MAAGLSGPWHHPGSNSQMLNLYQRSLILTHLTAFLCPLARHGHGTPGGSGADHHKRAATRRAAKGTRPSVGRNGLLGAQWDSGRRLPDAQGIALHTAPTQEAISAHQMGHYQRPLVLSTNRTLKLSDQFLRADHQGQLFQAPYRSLLSLVFAELRGLR